MKCCNSSAIEALVIRLVKNRLDTRTNLVTIPAVLVPSFPFLTLQMIYMLFRRVVTLKTERQFHLFSAIRHFSARPLNGNEDNRSPEADKTGNSLGSINNDYNHLSSFFSGNKPNLQDCKIELVDEETWRVSTELASAWRTNVERASETKPLLSEDDGDGMVNCMSSNKEEPDLDEIEDMRIRGILFYKLDKHSKEYEEYKFDFHRRNASKNKNVKRDNAENNGREEKLKNSDALKSCTKEDGKKSGNDSKSSSRVQNSLKNKDALMESNKSDNVDSGSSSVVDFLSKNYDEEPLSHFQELRGCGLSNKRRPLTFNQLTAPYHEPFCLEIYLSKGSVRASVVHRATSKVVAVAHSISKDMKFDLASTKNRTACAAVGRVLAQRALADDIHNVVYMPKQGEKLEGKRQIVLQSITDGGVNVKVKMKQRNH